MATEQIPTTLIADDAVTNAKIGADAVSTTEIANDASISTSGNIATTGSGTLTVAGTSTLTGALTASGGIANAGTISAGTIGNNVVRPNAIGIYGQLSSSIVASGSDQANFTFSASNKFINGVTESGGEITCPTAGKYLGVFFAQCQTTANNHYFELALQMKPSGGSYTTYGNTGAIGYQWTMGSRSNWGCQAIMQCSANSVVRLRHYSANAGGTLYAGESTTFSLFLIES